MNISKLYKSLTDKERGTLKKLVLKDIAKNKKKPEIIEYIGGDIHVLIKDWVEEKEFDISPRLKRALLNIAEKNPHMIISDVNRNDLTVFNNVGIKTIYEFYRVRAK